MLAGWLADRINKRLLLANGYFMAAVMALALVLSPMTVRTFALVL